MLKNTATKWIVYAYTVATGLPIAGDAANITAGVRIDGGGAVALTDTNPTELAAGYYVFDITAAECNGDLILIIPVSGTSGVRVMGMPETERTTLSTINGKVDTIVTDVGLVKVSTAGLGGAAMRGTDSAALASVCTEARLSELDAASAGKMAYVADVIAADVDGLNGAAMRGTDNAALASVCTETRLAELDAANLPADVAATADAVWDELMAGHVTDGSSGVAMGSPEKGLVVTDALNTTISFKTDLASTVDSYCIGCFVKFLTGNLVNQTRRIQAYGGTSKLMLVTSAFSETPIAGDKFIIVNQ